MTSVHDAHVCSDDRHAVHVQQRALQLFAAPLGAFQLGVPARTSAVNGPQLWPTIGKPQENLRKMMV